MAKIDTSSLVYDRINGDTYEVEDVNRVISICKAITGKYGEIDNMRNDYDVAESEHSGIKFPKISFTTVKNSDFAVNDTYSSTQMNNYLNNIKNIVNKIPSSKHKPLPSSMRFLTVTYANNIEENLKHSAEEVNSDLERVENNIIKTSEGFQYSNEIYAGGII